MGRRAGISHNETRLRAHLAASLRSAIGNERGALSRAAIQVGITKQALSLYLQQKSTPTPETLRKLCSGLQLKIDIDGAIISAVDPAPHRKTVPQLSLFEAISNVEAQQLRVQVVNRGEQSMELRLSIDFAKQTVTTSSIQPQSNPAAKP